MAAIAMAWASATPNPTEAAGPPNPDMSMEVVGVPGCTTDQDPPAASCNAPAGTFTIRVRLNSIARLPDDDGDGKAGFLGFQARVLLTGGMTVREVRTLSIWPDCAFPHLNLQPTDRLLGCITGIGANESTYAGPVAEVDIDCPQAPGVGQVTMRPGTPLDSLILSDGNTGIVDKDGLEILTVACSEPPLPPPPPPTGGSFAVDCDAGSPGVQVACAFGSGAALKVLVHVAGAPTGGYIYFGIALGWDGSVLGHTPTTDPAEEALWSHCDLASRPVQPSPDVTQLDCQPIALPVADTYVGPVAEFEFRCEEPGVAAISLLEPGGLTIFGLGAGGVRTPDVADGTVTCTEALAVGGTGSLPDVAGLPASGGTPIGLLATVAGAAAIVAGGGAWVLRRRWA
jgi:hypothetical protein